MKDLTQFKWFESEHDNMVSLLKEWVSINTRSFNLTGLDKFREKLIQSFSVLNGDFQELELSPRKSLNDSGHIIELPTAKALSISKRPDAPFRIFFGGHMDTVLFFHITEEDGTIRGPGVADMKGGLIIMLKVLEAIENSPFKDKLGWEVLINPDEELGSPSSGPLFAQRAKGCNIGLIFEPSHENGSLVSERKGSMNFSLVAKGIASHAGREFNRENNAITKLVKALLEIESLNNPNKGIRVNLGQITGGHSVNTVPDLAIGRFNIRIDHKQDMDLIKQKLIKISSVSDLQLHKETERPPKPFDKRHENLFNKLEKSAKSTGIDLNWQPSGGVCDGNLLAAAGIPTIDTLGVIGGNLHTKQEYVKLSSLTQRAKLAYALVENLISERSI